MCEGDMLSMENENTPVWQTYVLLATTEPKMTGRGTAETTSSLQPAQPFAKKQPSAQERPLKQEFVEILFALPRQHHFGSDFSCNFEGCGKRLLHTFQGAATPLLGLSSFGLTRSSPHSHTPPILGPLLCEIGHPIWRSPARPLISQFVRNG